MNQNGKNGDRKTFEFDLQAKWYINGFPKAGTHFALGMISPLAKLMPSTTLRNRPWASSWQNTFTHERRYWPVLAWQLAELAPGHAFKAHCGYDHDLEAYMFCLGYCHIFVYRDPRDVAVSLLHHILSDNENLIHDGRDKFKALDSDEAILRAIIEGYDKYPGIMERWEDYAGWLKSEQVFKFRYEDAIADQSKMAENILLWSLDRLGEIFCIKIEGADSTDLVKQMVNGACPEKSATYRAGRVGDWKNVFTGEHKKLFKQTDKNNWLVKLGYEANQDW